MKCLILLLTVFILIVGCHSAQKLPECSQCRDTNSVNSFMLLANSECFRLGGIGYAGVTSQEEIALRKLMKQENASLVLEELFFKGTLTGQLYALMGLRFVDKAKYEKLFPQLSENHKEVSVQEGCIVHSRTVKEIVNFMETGNYDFFIQRKLPSDSDKLNPR